MSDRLDLVSHHLWPHLQWVAIALMEKGIAFRRTYVDLADKPGWFNAISPLGKVPLLRVRGDGGEAVLYESAVICEYLEDAYGQPLHPGDALERARHRGWIEFASATLNDIAGFYNAADAGALQERQVRLTDRLAWIERHLDDSPYFAGADFSLVDAAMAPMLRYFDTFERIAGFGFFTETPGLRRYRAGLSKRTSVKKAVTADYPCRLEQFLHRRGSALSVLMTDQAA